MAEPVLSAGDIPRTLRLRGFGVSPTPVAAVTRHLSMKERIARAGRAFGVAFLAALLMLPIPIIHIIGPPLAIIIGIVLGLRRLGEGEIFVSAEGSCPFCHHEQYLGMAQSRFSLPRTLTCRSCRQPLELEANSATA
ncbi:MAG TPA: hypothetical protein VMJ30_10665 [Gemmatimonadales bacterium]|nr:hypothetical protein [Gemmatimonadales bacterium]